ncbi:MAG TPA: GNAT family N-acetyltransferase [Clostridiales bacterium]|nr:GNAT family N-acetyltransferase [Clostridiales bacterium]
MVFGKIISGNDDISEALIIRKEVFQIEQGVDPKLEFDDLDKLAMHAMVYTDINRTKAVATGRILLLDDKCVMGRVAVLKDFRGKEYGDFVVRLLLNRAFTSGIKEVFIHSQLSAVGFYEKLGFKILGEQFLEAGIRHVEMSIKEEFLTKKCNHI